MGRMQASSMKEEVDNGAISLDAALRWHLTSNHYPPLPECLIEVAKTAIQRANEAAFAAGNDACEYDSQITIPDNLSFRGKRHITVREAIESMHLESFLES